jgi:hypothetical protein
MAYRDRIFRRRGHERKYHAPGDQLMEAQATNLDELDQAILARRVAQRESVTTPRLGDFVRFSDRLERISYDWGDAVQTSKGGSFYLGKDGYASYSGCLNASIPKEQLRATGEILDGHFWFFHRDFWTAHNGVDVTAPCGVYDYER